MSSEGLKCVMAALGWKGASSVLCRCKHRGSVGPQKGFVGGVAKENQRAAVVKFLVAASGSVHRTRGLALWCLASQVLFNLLCHARFCRGIPLHQQAPAAEVAQEIRAARPPPHQRALLRPPDQRTRFPWERMLPASTACLLRQAGGLRWRAAGELSAGLPLRRQQRLRKQNQHRQGHQGQPR